METKVKRREWVKTAAIIFLAVLLVLTFFSNTINNASLPEVATQMASSGSIKAAIRGEGIVSALETYEVKLEQSRRIKSVMVREGQEVIVGDTLFLLEDEESAELKTARAELDSLRSSYTAKSIDLSNTDLQNDYDIQKAKAAYEAALSTLQQYTAADADAVEAEKISAEEYLRALKSEQTQMQNQLSQMEAQEAANAAQTVEPNDGASGNTVTTYSNPNILLLKAQIANISNQIAQQQSYVDSLTLAENAAQTVKTTKQAYDDLVFKKSLGSTSTADLSLLGKQIAEKQKEVDKLEEKTTDAVVTANAAGVISGIAVRAGDMAGAEVAICTINVIDRGFSIKISVTNDQAKKVRVGERAELVNAWWNQDLVATLENIETDPEKPGKNKLLVFRLEGDADVGQSLTLSIGQKSANFDCIVPNTAMKTDNNGTFVLVVTAKSTPLGNRYTATRVPVVELAKDDKQTAVSGLSAGEFVITTSSKPIEAGKQVRLADEG